MFSSAATKGFTRRLATRLSPRLPFALTPILSQRRWLNLHEYQSKKLLNHYGLKIQNGGVASTPEEAFAVASKLKSNGAKDLILKCQVLAGGRGKGRLTSGLQGGVKLCRTPEEVQGFAKQMIGYSLITHQTTAQGEFVKKVVVLEGVNITKELYLAIVLDRKQSCPVFIASRMGGMDIEEVVEKNPDALKTIPVDINIGVTPQAAGKIAEALGLAGNEVVIDQVQKLYKLFKDSDAIQVEINPLAVTDSKGSDNIVCVDAKIQFDDSAAYRQKELFAMEDKDSKDPREAAAESAGLNFVGMEGNIGCLVNGAGLAMATMDIIKLHGGAPANFLDVGGGANVDQVTQAFRILQSDPNVRALFVNIFGGIMKCDIIANGLVEAAKSVSLRVPLVVRLVGNNVEAGKKILQQSGIKCDVIDDFESAAIKVCRHVM